MTARSSPSASCSWTGCAAEIVRAARGPTGCRGLQHRLGPRPVSLDGPTLRQAVLDGEPRVMLDDNSATGNSIAIDPFQLQPGEAAQVGDAVVAALRGRR